MVDQLKNKIVAESEWSVTRLHKTRRSLKQYKMSVNRIEHKRVNNQVDNNHIETDQSVIQESSKNT